MVSDLFNIVLSKGDNQRDQLESGNYPLVSAGTQNNGICGFVKTGDGRSEIFKGSAITVDMFGKAFYQESEFFAVSHGRVNICIPKIQINKYIGEFFVKSLDNSVVGKYSYNRMCSATRIATQKIVLPVTAYNEPDYKYMESYVKKMMVRKTAQYVEYAQKRLTELQPD